MTYLVWRYGTGQRPGDASKVDAIDHESAATTAHERMDEPDTEEVFFVQLVRARWAKGHDRKVRVVYSELQYEPAAYGREERDLASLKARCSTCKRRRLDEAGPLVGGLCRGCGYKQWLRATA